ncbi:MAG: nitrile hydratase accessory protein [Betaproteobacteria bacterium]|nr:nitrile hydratase accessory protein [Gammaproteobacteria bacterium]MDH3437866.1 nitrile hydratase accessory protein [Betaproteobacteria bacterium]
MTTSIRPEADLGALPAFPRDDEGPVFKAPWEAQAFAMTLTLHTRGVFTWREWADALAAELAAASARGEPDDGTHYYEHWLAALEKLVARKKLIPGDELERRVDEWDAAAQATPHGKPIELPPH